ncbi:MAG: LacI family transcriptional regulator [Cellulomonas sp. 73-145]|uniref:LacI family DNA-binding transcriptional regulator n=1 Tax=Cellulomonas sp. 73-145 TaxID=1895739 RepID=UPI00092894DA|nr:LacI family DNA-binding transcriptional regulator [Cellulomonas sp. 73-145]OJV57026.1 MAG: LacI family transcriptional regulator [Cellulomonas sp. 73-145]
MAAGPQGAPGAPQPPRASIGDVARLAGVAPITVSRVANGSDAVRPATRERVQSAMAMLGYAPNTAARALRNGSFETIGLVAHRFARTGESRTIEGVVEAARAEGYTVALVDVVSPADVSEAATRLRHQAVDGLIVIRAEVATPTDLALPPGMPVVVSDSRFVGHHAAVGSDQIGGSRSAVEHLLGLGHPTVHHIAGPADSAPAVQREETWQETLRRAGRPVPPVLRGDWTPQSGYALGAQIADDPSVTAVYSANDEMAAGLMRALHERGVRVPEDVSVVGFDDAALTEFLWPPLTTVRQDFRTIGSELVRLLLAQVRDHVDVSREHVVVGTTLQVRASTGPYRPRG